RKVEKALKDAMKADKARSTVGRISPNGLIEINRQRIQQALQLRTHRPCPTCNGVGRLASEEMVSLSILRRIEARAATGSIQGVRIGLHPELADALQNHYRRELSALEEEFDIDVQIVAAAGLHRPDEQIEWAKRERPVPPPRHAKPAVPTLQAWDLALPEPMEDEEEEPEGTAEGHDEEEEHGAPGEAGKRRKRRRGGRKRKKPGQPAANGSLEAEPAALPPAAPEGNGGEEGAFYEAEGDDDFDDEGPEDSEAPGEGAEPGAGGGVKRRRRRRRRRK
ncbi:MAG TPA: hypothetical protein VF414_10485, partial [Thermoanaerobaculia bacterium]